MLFDLKGKRKRFIQVTYVALAVLFAFGLVGFGIGGGTNGGILDAITGNGGGGGSTSVFNDRVTSAERVTRLHPKEARAWRALAQARFNLARAGDGYDPSTGQFTDKAGNDLTASANAWERYLSLKPRKP